MLTNITTKSQHLLIVIRAFEERYVVRYVNIRLTSIIEDLMCADILPVDNRAIYVRYIIARS